MSFTLYLAPLICLCGLALFIVATGNWKEVGKTMFFCGLLASLLLFPGSGSLNLGPTRAGSTTR